MKKTYIILILFAFFCSSLTWAAPDSIKVKREKVTLPSVRLSPEIMQLLKTGKWDPAIKKLIGVYKGGFADPNLKYYVAYCYEELATKAVNEKRFKDGINFFDKAIQYVDDQAHPYNGLGFSYFSLSQYEEAETAYLQALDLAPKNFQVNSMLGEICYLTNRLINAQEYWETALEIEPANKYVKKRLEGLKKTIRLSEDHEKEEDMSFSVSFNGSQKPRLRELVLNMLEDISHSIGQELQLYPNRQIPVILLTNKAFHDITGSPKWAGGAYEGHIKIPVDKYKIEPLRQVLTHEYIHAVIYDRLSYRCPWWLNEGIAQFFSGDKEGNNKKLKLAVQIIKKGSVPSLEKLSSLLKGGDPLKVKKAYALALSAVTYFIDSYGTLDLQYILDLMADGKTFGSIISEITTYSFIEFQENWKNSQS